LAKEQFIKQHNNRTCVQLHYHMQEKRVTLDKEHWGEHLRNQYKLITRVK